MHNQITYICHVSLMKSLGPIRNTSRYQDLLHLLHSYKKLGHHVFKLWWAPTHCLNWCWLQPFEYRNIYKILKYSSQKLFFLNAQKFSSVASNHTKDNIVSKM